MTTFYARVETLEDGDAILTQESGWKSLAGDLHTAVIRSEAKEHAGELSWRAVLPGTVVKEAIDAHVARLALDEPPAGSPAAQNARFYRELATREPHAAYLVTVDEY